MSDPTAWPAGKTFGELTPAQKIAAGKRAAAQLQDELQRNSAAISAAMDTAEAGELDQPTHASRMACEVYRYAEENGDACIGCGAVKRWEGTGDGNLSCVDCGRTCNCGQH